MRETGKVECVSVESGKGVCVVTYCLYKGAVVVTASSKSRGSVADVRRAMVDFISASRSLKILMFLSSSVCQRERDNMFKPPT